jgi:tRNA(Ile)-lysidine synthase TilS/MesJ
LIAITVDEGISTTFLNNQREIEKFFSQTQISIPLIRTSYKEKFGSTMDEMVNKLNEKGLKVNACTICASIRRRIINEIAKKNGATKIAIGHNLDDVAQSLIMNVLRNDFKKIQTSTPFNSSIEDLSPFLPRIKPLFLFSEEEIIHYCEAKQLPYFSKICQNALDFPILRKKVQIFLNELDRRSFEFKYNLIQFHLQVNEHLPKLNSRIQITNLCKSCSYPTGSNRDLCTYCEFKQIFTED